MSIWIFRIRCEPKLPKKFRGVFKSHPKGGGSDAPVGYLRLPAYFAV
jgi:hypothetical protein